MVRQGSIFSNRRYLDSSNRSLATLGTASLYELMNDCCAVILANTHVAQWGLTRSMVTGMHDNSKSNQTHRVSLTYDPQTIDLNTAAAGQVHSSKIEIVNNATFFCLHNHPSVHKY